MSNTSKPICALCGTDDPLFNMWIIVTLKKHGNIVNKRLCPCCGTHYDRDPRLLQKAPESIANKGKIAENPLLFRKC